MPRSTVVKIPTENITDWETFHDVFQRTMGFPAFYGRNMNAWIDCMTSLDCPEDGLTQIHAPENGVLTLHFDDYQSFAQRLPEISAAIIECAAFVNWRRIEAGEPSVLALSFRYNSTR